jgi:hypothetical protein
LKDLFWMKPATASLVSSYIHLGFTCHGSLAPAMPSS